MVMGSKSSDAIFESMEKDFTDATVSFPHPPRDFCGSLLILFAARKGLIVIGGNR